MNDTTLDTLATPGLVLDMERFERNVERMRTRIAERGGTLRLHAKTNKSIEATRRVLGESHEGRIMVSTLQEARYFHRHGIRDIVYGVGIVAGKLDEVAQLLAAGADLKVVLDSVQMARALAERGRQLGVEFRAYIEVDSDGHRAGVPHDAAELLEIGQVLAQERGAALAGVLTHAGASYQCRSLRAIREMAEQERRLVVAAAQRLRAAGIDCREVSLGSTPTATCGISLEDITEVRAGVYVFQDLVMAGLGVCGIEDIALSVLATVIGQQRSRNWAIVDAGWMALSRDRGTASQPLDQGYGLVCDQAGRPLEDLIVVSSNQEHGVIADRHGRPLDFAQLAVGTRLRILPNHACATAAQHDRYHVAHGQRIDAVWPRVNYW